MHESVLVGYFCQAVGWISRDLMPTGDTTSLDARLMQAINLSHNPLDPVIGDMILQLDDLKNSSSEFFIFEFKREWNTGVKNEKQKLTSRRGKDVTIAFITSLLTAHPTARSAHIFGALVERQGFPTTLETAPYWYTLYSKSPPKSIPILRQLVQVVQPTKGTVGMKMDELTAYISALNAYAEEGAATANGTARFVVAYRDYRLHTFHLNAIHEYQLHKQRELRMLTEKEQTLKEDSKEVNDGPDLSPGW